MLEQCLYFLFLALAEHFEQQGPNVIARVAKETLRCTSIYASCSFRKKWQTVENRQSRCAGWNVVDIYTNAGISDAKGRNGVALGQLPPPPRVVWVAMRSSRHVNLPGERWYFWRGRLWKA
jgi:hypothetical protein